MTARCSRTRVTASSSSIPASSPPIAKTNNRRGAAIFGRPESCSVDGGCSVRCGQSSQQRVRNGDRLGAAGGGEAVLLSSGKFGEGVDRDRRLIALRDEMQPGDVRPDPDGNDQGVRVARTAAT